MFLDHMKTRKISANVTIYDVYEVQSEGKILEISEFITYSTPV